LNIVIKVTGNAAAGINTVNQTLKKTATNMNTVKKATIGMNKEMLGLGLGMTFFLFGVQIQLQRMLRNMFNIFKLAEGEAGLLNQQFNMLRVSLAAISIAFFDAFAQSGFFEIIIDIVSRIVDWYLDLTDKQREWFSSGVIGAFGLMKVMSFFGQILLAVFVLTKLNIAAWGPWAIIGLAAIGAIIAFYIKYKDTIKETTDALSKSNEIFWEDWKLKALNSILGVLNTFLLFQKLILKVSGVDITGGLLEIFQEKIDQSEDTLKRLNAALKPHRAGAIERALGIGEVLTRPLEARTLTPGGIGRSDLDREIQEAQLAIQEQTASELGDLNLTMSDVKKILDLGRTITIEEITGEKQVKSTDG